MKSLHFNSDLNKCFISFSQVPSTMIRKNGEKVPDQKYFKDAEYDVDSRTFRGSINWNDNPIRGTGPNWKYECKFSHDFRKFEIHY